MLLQNAAMVAKELRVGNKIAACFKQICLMGVICKVSNMKTLPGETFHFLTKHLLSIFKSCALSTFCFLMSY